MGQYDSFLDDYERQQQGAQSAGIAAASTLTQTVNPDQAGRARATARYLGTPVAAVEALPAEAEEQARLKKITEDTVAAPTLRKRYTDADFMKLARDDSFNLSQIEKGVRAFMAGGQFKDEAAAAVGLIPRAGRAIASGAPKMGAGLYGAAAAPAELLGFTQFGGFLREQQRKADAEAARWSPTNPDAGIVERGVMSGLQSAGQGILTLPIGVAAGSNAMLGAIGTATFGQSYGKGRDAGLSPARAVPYAAQDATAEVVTERYLGAAGFLQQVKAGASAGKLFMYELLREVPGEMSATLWQNFNEWANLHPDKPVGQFIQEQPAALAETVIATLVGGTTQIGAVKATEKLIGRAGANQQRAEQAEQQAQGLQQMMQTIAANKVRERDQATFQGFLQSVTEDGPLEKLYLNPQEMQKAGIDLTQLAEVAPGAAAAIQQALETGTDIGIPTSELATLLPGTPLEPLLLQHLKTDPGGYSQAGAQEFMKTRGDAEMREVERVMDEHKADTAFKESIKAVGDDVQQQLATANRFTDDVNAPYSALWSAFFGVQAARVGVMPRELYDRFAPKIVAQTSAGALLDQDVPLKQTGRPVPRTEDEYIAAINPEGKRLSEQDVPAVSLKDLEAMAVPNGSTKVRSQRIKGGKTVAVWRTKLGDAIATVDGQTVGYIAPSSYDATLAHVAKEFQGRGIGNLLSRTYRASNPYAPTGGLTEAGERTARSTFRYLRDRGYLEAPTLKQGEVEVTRGSFNPQTNTVALLKAADLSTFLHESGHFFLEVMHDLASQPDAPQQIKDDFATFLKWTGVESAEAWGDMTLDQQREHHENFARGFEAYLFEGKAPSVQLQALFQRFRAWLLNVYRSIASLDINLTPEIRGVFDRMLATTEEIKLAEDVQGYEALFKNKPEGMTGDEWAVYQVQANDATQQAITELESRSLRDMKWLANAKSRELKRLQKEAAKRRGEIEAEVRAEVEAEPIYQAIAAIKEQRHSDPTDRAAQKAWRAEREAEETRLTAVVRDQYLATPEGTAAKGILRGQFLARSKRQMANEVEKMMLQWEQQNPKPKVVIPEADLQAVAALHGFSSGDELQKAIDGAQPLKEVVEGMTDQRMLERHGDLVDERSIERAAEEAIHNDARLRFTATELNALRKATGQPALLAKAIRQFAADIIARTKVRELKPSVYTAAERRAAGDAAKAAAENKLEDAAIQKRNQLINGHAAKLTLEAQGEAAKLVKYLASFNKESVYGSMDPDYIDQIHKLLERFDLRTGQSLKAIDNRAGLKDWIESQEEAGLEPDIPPELKNEANRTSYKNLTMEQLRGLSDTVKQIEHLGRLKHKLLTAKDQRDYEAIRDSIVASINEHAGDKMADNRTRPTVLNAAIRMFDGYLLEHRKLASLVREMDGFQDGGTMWEYIVRSMNEAGDTEATMRAKAATELAALVKPMLEGGKRGGRGQFFASVGKSFNREERLGIALNMGNAGNIQRLLDGEGWTLTQLKPVLDTLTAADWHFVQSVWDHLESYRPLVAAKERRVYGKEPNWVEPQPLKVETADGKTVQLRGGYYPIKYDTAQSGRAEALADAEAAKQMMRGAFTSATTRRSFTKPRSEEVSGRPLLYSTDALFNGVNEIIHDLSWHEWLIDANRLLRSKSIDNAVRSRYGAEVMQQLKSAVKDIAAGEIPSTKAFERISTNLRAGTMIAGLGLNIVNSIVNVQGITQSMVRIGPKWTAVGVGKFAQGPIELSREVAGKSKMMANRAKTLNREVNEIQSLLRDKSAARHAVDRIMFLPLTMTQQVVDLPTWWGAYQKALDEGNKEDRAVSMADQAVLDAQSGGQMKDLAGIQRGHPALKLWTVFYGFFSSTYNLTVESTKATDFKDPMQVVGLAGKYLLLWTLPAFIGTLMKNLLVGGDWDEDKLAKKIIGDQISYVMGMLVGVREFAAGVQAATGTSEYGATYGGPAGARFVGELTKLMVQASQGEVDAAFLKSLSNTLGILFKLPSGQVNRTVEGTKALVDGDTSNPLAIVAGPPPKK